MYEPEGPDFWPRVAAAEQALGVRFELLHAFVGWTPRRSGQLPRMLGEAAAQQQRELDRWLTALTSVLGPAVILLVGAIVLFIVLAILLPIFNLNQMVK